VSLERGARRVFASALDWPGWSRAGRDEESALDALAGYGRRYARAMGAVARDLEPPRDRTDLTVVERLAGNSGTDFGVPTLPLAPDGGPVDAAARERFVAILRASWQAIDEAAAAAVGAVLRKGPRGGGRELDRIVDHVMEAERAYVAQIGGENRLLDDADPTARMADVRRRALESLDARLRGDPLPPKRRASTIWLIPYFVRRSAWHALDHAWEIEDRARPDP
jgi:hypothetical protein